VFSVRIGLFRFSGNYCRKHFVRGLALLTIIALASHPLIADSIIVHRGVLTGLPKPQLKNILVIPVIENCLIRQHFEDEMEKLPAKSGFERIESHLVLPPRNEMMEGELKQRIKEADLDAVLAIRPNTVRQETEEVITGGISVPPPGYCSFWPYWNMAYGNVYPSSSYTQQLTVVRAEFNLYNTKDEKLLWSRETDTVYSKASKNCGKATRRCWSIRSKGTERLEKRSPPTISATLASRRSCRVRPAAVL
jgi:hypothetical protein